MSSWPECDDTFSNKEIWVNQMNKKKLLQMWNESAGARSLAKSLESYDRFKALNAYREMRAKRQYTSDKDIALYTNDKSIQVN